MKELAHSRIKTQRAGLRTPASYEYYRACTLLPETLHLALKKLFNSPPPPSYESVTCSWLPHEWLHREVVAPREKGISPKNPLFLLSFPLIVSLLPSTIAHCCQTLVVWPTAVRVLTTLWAAPSPLSSQLCAQTHQGHMPWNVVRSEAAYVCLGIDFWLHLLA